MAMHQLPPSQARTSPFPGLTARQFELVTIVDYCKSHAQPAPSYQDIADLMGCSRMSVIQKIKSLVSKGVLVCDRYVHRSLRMTPRAERIMNYLKKEGE